MTRPRRSGRPRTHTSRSPWFDGLRKAFRLLDGLETGVLLLDAQGTVLRANSRAARQLGLLAAEAIGRDLFRELLPELEREGWGAECRRQLAGGTLQLEWERTSPAEPLRQAFRFTARSISFHQATWALVVVEDRARQGEGGVPSFAEHALEAAGSSQTSPPGGVGLLLAHETVEALPDAGAPMRECARIAGAVEEAMGSTSSGTVETRGSVDLTALVEQVIRREGDALASEGVEVLADLGASLPAVMGDSEALQELVRLLLANARGALAHRPDRRLLAVRTRALPEGVVVLTVMDNAPGIPQDALARVFGGQGDPRVPQGGAALQRAAAIVREHGGGVAVESEQERGAAIVVRLPALAPASSAAPGLDAPEPGPRRALRVLVADDEATLRHAIGLFLGRRGHQVVQACDAWEALRLAETHAFDVALVDARMPGDGLRLLERLEAMPSLHQRTVLMTGDLGRTRNVPAVAAGRPRLAKPFDMNAAVELIERVGQ